MWPTGLCQEERKETAQHLDIGTRMYVTFIKYTYEGMLKALHTTILIEKIFNKYMLVRTDQVKLVGFTWTLDGIKTFLWS